MNLTLFPLLSTRSRRAIRRKRKRYGHPYDYRPRGNLIARLAHETGRSKEWVYDRLMEERQYLLTLSDAEVP